MCSPTFVAAGGANFIGASSYLLKKVGKKTIGIDWGRGIPDGQPQYEGELDYFFATHGHDDHIGLLPVLHRRWPKAKLFATRETKELAKISWRQTLARFCEDRHRPYRYRREMGEAPFTAEEVAATEEAIIEIRLNETFTLDGDGEIEVSTYRGGHILGATSFRIRHHGEDYFFTGDVSFQEGIFVPAADRVTLDRCRLLVRESVYLNEEFEDRQKVEREFVRAAAEVLAQGGQLLIPALSIHRTQEVYALLKLADLGPVIIDGSRRATEIYRQYVPRGNEILDDIPRFESRHQREQFFRSGMPAIIIASSGMVYENTLSAMWAERFLPHEDRYIFTVNYQDPCGQGRVLLNAKHDDFIVFNGKIINKRCQVRHFQLSAHMDKRDGEEMEERLNPDVVVYVHGEDYQIEKYLQERNGRSRTRIKSEVGKEVSL